MNSVKNKSEFPKKNNSGESTCDNIHKEKSEAPKKKDSGFNQNSLKGEKKLQSKNTNILLESFEIYDAWITNKVDADNNGYYESIKLHWDPDVSGTTSSQNVYAKVYTHHRLTV